jgi:NTE family protein
MEIENSSFMRKRQTARNFKPLLVAALLVLNSCAQLRTRSEINEQKASGGNEAPGSTQETPVQAPRYEIPGPVVTPPPTQIPTGPTSSPIPAIPKIGLIFGPGGAKAYGHIGFIQNLTHMKIPVFATVGIEWGAPIAALFASKGQVYDVEWQMFKLKDDAMVKKTLLGSGGKVTDVTALHGFFQNAFAGQKAESFHHPFACPAYNIAKNQVYMMSRGLVDQIMPYCMPYPPLFKPFNRNVSAIREVKMASDYLRSQGANYIVMVNVLGRDGGKKGFIGDADSTESVVWSEIASFYARPQPGVDATINLELDQFGLNDFDKKREIMQKGAEVSQKPLAAWARKLGF